MDFDFVYQTYFKDVLLYVRSLSAKEHIAEEITQEAFTKALKSLDSFDGKKDIRTWLFTIAKNTYYTYCRRQKIFNEYEPHEELSDPQPDLTERLVDDETASCIHQYLHQMKSPPTKKFFLYGCLANYHLKKLPYYLVKAQAGPVWFFTVRRCRSKNI